MLVFTMSYSRKNIYKILFYLAKLLRTFISVREAKQLIYVGIDNCLEGREQQARGIVLRSRSPRSRPYARSLPGVQKLEKSFDCAGAASVASSSKNTERLLALSRNLSKKGSLVEGWSAYQHASKQLRVEHRSTRGLFGSMLNIKLAIQDGDMDRAQYFAERIKNNLLVPNYHIYSLVSYVDIWLFGQTRVWERGARAEAGPSHGISGQSVLVIGKGAVGPRFFDQQGPEKLIARILTPVSENTLAPSSVGDSKTYVAYANGETTKWLRRFSQDDIVRLLEPFDHVAFKNGVPRMLRKFKFSRLREAVNPNLFLCGSANMAQIIALDLLAQEPGDVFFTGTSLFLGNSPYRADQHRYRVDGPIDDAENVNRVLLDSLSKHNAWENWQVLKNLWQMGRIHGDEHFESALRLSTENYLAALEESLSS